MNNEEKILEKLEKLEKTQEAQVDLLKRQGIIIELLSKTQQEQGMKLLEQGAALKSIVRDVDEVRRVSQRTAVLMETEISDKIQLLFDGHSAIIEKLDELAPKGRVELLEDDVAMMKDVIKLMRLEISELKKAQ